LNATHFDSVNLTLIVFDQRRGGQAEGEFGSAQAEPIASEDAEGQSNLARNCELPDRLLG
jgi:hypothetical protein